MLERPTKPATRWQRNYRRRQKAGVMLVGVEVDGAILDLLCRNGWVSEASAADKAAVGHAITSLLADAARDASTTGRPGLRYRPRS